MREAVQYERLTRNVEREGSETTNESGPIAVIRSEIK
jgi:hypothetical protein